MNARNELDNIFVILIGQIKPIFLCLEVPFDDSMLSWKKGLHDTDGVWGKHWYNNVINTTKFEISQNKYDNVPEEYQSIYDEALYYYKKLYYFVL